MGNDFKTAVEHISDIASAYKSGIQAIKGNERPKFSFPDSHCIKGSVDIDNALKSKYPEQNRWDYAIGYGDLVVYAEVHPCSTSEVSTIINKRDWLLGWLKDTALNKFDKSLYWVATQGVAIKDAKKKKELSMKGIKVCSKLEL
ncbi:MAG: hypothetical protein MJZ61_06815 [Bacteroidales bacterium]|nr:hypothetical protein [Bacteroidales bacterium]